MTLAVLAAAMTMILPAAPKARINALAPMLLFEAVKQGVNPLLVIAVAARESAYRQDVIGQHGELGALQVNPLGRATQWCTADLKRLHVPRVNIKCGVILLRKALAICQGNEAHALNQYNGGRCESSRYAKRVMQLLERLPNR